MKWPRYPKLKPSGVEWLGEVPEGWDVKRLRRIARLKSGDSITSEELQEGGEYPVYGGNGIRGTFSRFTHRGHYVLIGRQGALCGNINYASGEFWASEHAIVVLPLVDFSTVWMGELLRAMDLNQYSVSAAQPGLSVDRILSLQLSVPPRNEQHAIADFLDRETGKIDTLVAKNRTLIERLKEKRSALISRTVTRGLPPEAARAAGLDPHPKLKPSGVEWLGEVPEHWEVKRLKFLLAAPLKYGANEAAELDDPDLPRYVRITDIDENDGLREETFKSLPFELAAEYLLYEGDLLFARSGATAGKTFLYQTSWGKCAFAGYLIRARIDKGKAKPKFVRYFTASSHYWQWLSSAFIQATIQNVSAERYSSLWLPLPVVSEQRIITGFLDRETAKIDTLASKVETTIERLQEYRTALITAVVTGKIDVRGAVMATPNRGQN